MSVTYPDLTYNQLTQDPTVSPTIGFIDLDYYKTIYYGEDPDDDSTLTKLIIRASEDINAQTGFQIESLEDYDEFVKNLIYKATAAQTEWYVLNGENFNDTSNGSVTIGKFSYSKSSLAGTNGLSSRARMYLEQTGLMFRGC